MTAREPDDSRRVHATQVRGCASGSLQPTTQKTVPKAMYGVRRAEVCYQTWPRTRPTPAITMLVQRIWKGVRAPNR